jgi:uncharacterized protein
MNSHASPFAASQSIDEGLRDFFIGTYKQMMTAMAITGGIAWGAGSELLSLKAGHGTAIVPPGLLAALYTAPMVYVVMFAPLAIILFSGFIVSRAGERGARGILYGISALMGISTATIFVRYTGISIAQTFFATAIAFGGLSVFGYTTKRDLTAMGRFMIMGMIGMIGLSILNLFIHSSPLSFAISAAGILIFSGMTAYDTQKLKTDYLEMRQMGASDADIGVISTMGALGLYLDFLNLMMHLLRFMGVARND